MISREDIGGWMEGPGSRTRAEGDYPGRLLGRPEHGKGSIAGYQAAGLGRRILAIAIDWALCWLIAMLIFPEFLWGQIIVFGVENLLLVGTLGTTVGHRIAGVRVLRADGSWANPLRILLRTVLLLIVIPAVIWNRDGRGFHDVAAGTMIVQAR